MKLTLLLLLLFLVTPFAEGDTADNSIPISPWLRRGRTPAPRRQGCWFRPWICCERQRPLERRLCCSNRCIDVGSNADNCGLCGIRCPFRWRCCNGLCVDIMWNPAHCGSCDNRCSLGSRCLFGLCGYAEPVSTTPPLLHFLSPACPPPPVHPGATA
ncbi:protein STIG1-like [Zingiber officinale]|uniref:Stigma-specific Stig1 family protein n=1 Tax=Zingiber officinale TaxID=94328 RepID=A0A8J5LYP4_ZINOF|nr:protein STIG1-like [Zingiber officinale]KAG6527689.1 hypothetical protein ZIOFF_009815 [Zingiber officinale]